MESETRFPSHKNNDQPHEKIDITCKLTHFQHKRFRHGDQTDGQGQGQGCQIYRKLHRWCLRHGQEHRKQRNFGAGHHNGEYGQHGSYHENPQGAVCILIGRQNSGVLGRGGHR